MSLLRDDDKVSRQCAYILGKGLHPQWKHLHVGAFSKICGEMLFLAQFLLGHF